MKDKFIIRELKEDDYYNGYITCINELTTPVEVNIEVFTERYNLMKNKKDYYIVVAEELETGRILGSGTLFLEYKFIRGCVIKGHIEDIVVLQEKRGLGIGKRLVEHLLDHGKRKNCYKIALVCEEKNIKFYQKCGFMEKEHEMVIYT